MTYKDHINNLKSDMTVSAAKAIDFLKGNQIPHLETLLSHEDKGIKHWSKRGIIPQFENITAKIITRSGLSYQKQPERKIMLGEDESQELAAKYGEIVGYDGEMRINQSDRIARLLKACLIMPFFVKQTGEVRFKLLHQGNCDVDYDMVNEEIRSLIYSSGSIGPGGGEILHYWDASKVVDLELGTSRFGEGIKVLNSVKHPYSVVPAAVRYDIAPPFSGFWPGEEWSELISLNEAVNMHWTEARHAARKQTYPPLFTNANIPEGTIIGADSVVTFTGNADEIFLEYKTPPNNLAVFEESIAAMKEAIADSWSVNLRIGGGSSADSGFKLTVQETHNIDNRIQRQKAAKKAEESLFDVVKVLSRAHGLGIPDNAEIKVVFQQPELAVDATTEREQDRADFAAGIMSLDDIIKKREPGITEQEIEIKKQKLATTGRGVLFDAL